MSTSTTRLGLTKPASGENYSRAVFNNNMDLIDAGAIAATPEFVSPSTSDANWTYNGGLHIQNTVKKAAHLLLQMNRTAVGSFAITTAPLQVATIIPVGYRPSYSVTRYGVLQITSTGADKWGLHIKIDSSGRLWLSTDTGSSTVAQGDTVEMDMWWSL